MKSKISVDYPKDYTRDSEVFLFLVTKPFFLNSRSSFDDAQGDLLHRVDDGYHPPPCSVAIDVPDSWMVQPLPDSRMTSWPVIEERSAANRISMM